jgi:hypothetical protein
MVNKFCGIIGFVETVESDDPSRPGLWEQKVTERKYIMEIRRVSRRRDNSDKVNDDFTINNQLSVIMDPFARENFRSIAYAEYLGVKWKITSVDIEHDSPRMTLNVGGEYNAQQSGSA